ncbi:hypothetical protein CBL_04985 [Carabus blaptoides fortunei]
MGKRALHLKCRSKSNLSAESSDTDLFLRQNRSASRRPKPTAKNVKSSKLSSGYVVTSRGLDAINASEKDGRVSLTKPVAMVTPSISLALLGYLATYIQWCAFDSSNITLPSQTNKRASQTKPRHISQT